MESEQNKAAPSQSETPAWSARKLLRAARSGTLATSKDGQPFTALVTPATAADGSILLLLSSLSEHTRHLRADPRCAVMVVGQPDGPNPQTAPRLTITGLATLADPGLKSRWLARHPYADLYADFADFSLWQISARAGLLVAGFARAFRLRGTDVIAASRAVAAVSAAEAGMLARYNTDYEDMLAVIAKAAGGSGDNWQMVAIDVDGCDLANGQIAVRCAWPASVSNAEELAEAFLRLVRQARG